MSLHLSREIAKLKKQLLSLCAAAEENVQRAVAAVQARDGAAAQGVIDTDAAIDRAEIDVEEECLKILALHQPVAIDLRVIVACLKINNDLERIGDLAVNIAKRCGAIAEMAADQIPPDLPSLAAKSQRMLKKSLDALMSLDAALARQVLASDEEVDGIRLKLYELLEKQMRASPDDLHALIQLIFVTRCLERIADHATNIAEDVIYMLEGRIVRHGVDREAPGLSP